MQTSPVPVKTPTKGPEHQEGMSFPDAIRRVIDGECVTKAEWNDPRIYLRLNGEYLVIRKANGTESRIILRDGDLLGTDWRVVEPVEG